jgi:hypothetical protein
MQPAELREKGAELGGYALFLVPYRYQFGRAKFQVKRSSAGQNVRGAYLPLQGGPSNFADASTFLVNASASGLALRYIVETNHQFLS